MRPLFARATTGGAAERRQLEQQAKIRLREIEAAAARGTLFDNSESDYPTYRQAATFWWERWQKRKPYMDDIECSVPEWNQLRFGIEHFADTPIDRIRREDVKKFRMALHQLSAKSRKPWSNAYMNRIVAKVSSVFKYAINQEEWSFDTAPQKEREAFGRIDIAVNIDNPCKGLSKLYETPKPTRSLSLEELRRFLGELPRDLHRYIVVVGVHTGLRRRNLLRLRWTEIDLDRRIITPTSQKSGSVPIPKAMHPEVEWILRLLYPRRTFSEFVFADESGKPLTNFYRSWRAACKRAEIEGFTIRGLRTTYASLRVEEGAVMGLLQRSMDHSSVTTTGAFYNRTPFATQQLLKTQRSIGVIPQQSCDATCDATVTLPRLIVVNQG